MTSDQDAVVEDVRRLHPASAVFHVLGHAKGFLLPLVVLLVFARGETWELYAAFFIIPVGLYELFRYWTTTYRITQDQLVVRRGLLFRSERHIPFGRIQNIDLQQNLLHRLFGVAEVRIETASGSEPEANLQVVSLAEVDRIRRQVFARRGLAVADASRPPLDAADVSDDQHPLLDTDSRDRESMDDGVELLRLPIRELAKLGVVTFRGLTFVGIGLGLAWQFDLFEQAEATMSPAKTALFEMPDWLWYLVVTALAIVAIAAVTGLSILWAVVTLYDYRLLRKGEDLQVSCGLLTRLTATIPRRRIQLVSVRQSPLHRFWGRVAICVETASGGGDDDDVPVNRRWLVPLVEVRRAAELVKEIQPEFELFDVAWQPLPAAASRRMVRKAIFLGLLLSLPLIPLIQLWSFAAIPVVIGLLVLHARAMAKTMRYAQTETGMAWRSGVIVRRTSATHVNRVQTVASTQTPFDRRYDMASLLVDTAGSGPAGHRIEIPYLPRAEADRLRSELNQATAETPLRWA